MEKWEKDYIRKNLPELIENTSVEKALLAILLQKEIISSHDGNVLEAQSNKDAKSSSFYEIIQTRVGAYKGVIDALRETRQSGAYAILEKGQKVNTDENEQADSTETPNTTDCKWREYLQGHKQIYFVPNASQQAIEELTHRFYTEELKFQLKQHKFYSPHVLNVLQEQIGATLLEIYAQEAENFKAEHAPIQQYLARSCKQFKEKYISTLNGSRNSNTTPAIGIDLGTCNLCTAVCLEGRTKIFLNSFGDLTTPSYVAFGENGTRNIGKGARKKAYKDPSFTIFDSKRMIGRLFNDPEVQADIPHWPFRVNDVGNIPIIVTRDKGYVPEEISTLLIKECKTQAEKDLNKEVTKAVITVPAYFNDSQRKATERAGKEAGLDVLQILNEPTAAAITYRQERYYDAAKLVLVFDIGGGTFDVALVKIDDEIATLSTDGDTHLGGEDIDRLIVEYCINEFKKSSGINLRELKSPKNERNLARLQIQCEDAKRDLSTAQKVEITVDNVNADLDLEVTLHRHTFEKLCTPLFEKMLRIVERLITRQNILKEEIEDIILVGGSTRIPKLQEMLKEYFGRKELNTSINQDHAVAYGAAVQAAILNGDEVQKLLKINGIVDVIPMSFGIQCIKEGVHGKFVKIIEKDSRFPEQYSETLFTHKDNQNCATIRVFQGEQDTAADNFFIGEFLLEGIPEAPKGMQSIVVCMEINAMGVLKVTANCPGVSETKELIVNLQDSSGLQFHLDRRRSSLDLEFNSGNSNTSKKANGIL